VRRAFDPAVAGHAIFIVFAWGTNYPLMKLALRDIGPLSFSVARMAGGCVVLAILVALSRNGVLWPPRSEWRRLALSGILQYAGVLGFASVALTVMPAGRTAVAVYSMPLWAALFGALWLRERLALWQWLGLLAGAAGLALFLDPTVVAGAPLGTLMVLGAAASWGLGAVVHRRAPFRASPTSQAFFQLIAAGAVIAVLAVALERHHPIRVTPSLAAITVWNWLVPTSLTLWSWNRLLRLVPASTAGQLVMASPLAGIAASAAIFGERLSPAVLASTVLVIAGALMVIAGGAPRRAAKAAKAAPQPGDVRLR
jgi:drug/metabolite transporter (DMT)-like permease